MVFVFCLGSIGPPRPDFNRRQIILSGQSITWLLLNDPDDQNDDIFVFFLNFRFYSLSRSSFRDKCKLWKKLRQQYIKKKFVTKISKDTFRFPLITFFYFLQWAFIFRTSYFISFDSFKKVIFARFCAFLRVSKSINNPV